MNNKLNATNYPATSIERILLLMAKSAFTEKPFIHAVK